MSQVPKEAEMSAERDLIREQVRRDPVKREEWIAVLEAVMNRIVRLESINFSQLLGQIGVPSCMDNDFCPIWLWGSGAQWNVPDKEKSVLKLRCLVLALKGKKAAWQEGSRGELKVALLLPGGKWSLLNVGYTYLGECDYSTDSFQLEEVDLKDLLKRQYSPATIFNRLAWFLHETTRRRQRLYWDAKGAYDEIFELGDALQVRTGSRIVPIVNRVKGW